MQICSCPSSASCPSKASSVTQGKDPGLMWPIHPAASGSIRAQPTSSVLQATPAGLVSSSKALSCSLPRDLSNSRMAVKLSQTSRQEPAGQSQVPCPVWLGTTNLSFSTLAGLNLCACLTPLSAPPTMAIPRRAGHLCLLAVPSLGQGLDSLRGRHRVRQARG